MQISHLLPRVSPPERFGHRGSSSWLPLGGQRFSLCSNATAGPKRVAPRHALDELDNCITQATSRSIVAEATPQGGGGSNGVGAGSGGGGGGGGGGSGSESSGSGDRNGGGGKAHPMQLWTYVYAGVLALGGVMGFAKKGSSKSLGGGLSAALVLVLAARSMSAGAASAAGAQVAFAISLLMGIFFLGRYAKSKKIMPGGVGAGASLGMAVGYLVAGL